MKRLIAVAALAALVAGCARAQKGPSFDDWFVDKTLRVDYFHAGNANEETIALDQVYDQGIWAVSASGKGLRRLVPADGRDMRGLAWAPDGTRLAFGHGDGDYEVFVVNADGTGLTNLTSNEKIQDEWPSWSPDGKAITFVSDRDEGLDQIFARRADGSGQPQLTQVVGGAACCPTWSP